MDGVDCDWCLVCDKRTGSGATYCSQECRSSDLISSSASSSSSSASSSSSFSMTDTNGAPLPNCLGDSRLSADNYPMPPFIRKQRTSIPNIYAQCTSNPNPPIGASALSHHLHLQQQHLHHQSQLSATAAPSITAGNPVQGSAAAQYPLFYATLSALRPISPSGPQQDH